jgi:hypothetical protein
MRKTMVTLGMLVLLACWSVPVADAGALRYAGKKISDGTAVVADGATTAGKKTSSAVATGATAVVNGAKAAPGAVADGAKAVANGTKSVAKSLVKAIW